MPELPDVEAERRPRCRTALVRTEAAGRTTYLCPACQPFAFGEPVRRASR